METGEFSVLMSLYWKESPNNLIECFESLMCQTIKPNEWIIVEDGPLTKELYEILSQYEKKFPQLIKRVKLEKNVGLGLALREGILHCNNELVARMDTDDIADDRRFEKQINFFRLHPDVELLGGYISEFNIDPKISIGIRKVPISNSEIVKYQKFRDSFNHMTVMYKKSSIIKAGNYGNWPLMEDTMLWVNFFLKGGIAANIPDVLVYARADENLYKRRGGFDYFKKIVNARNEIYKTGFVNLFEHITIIFIQFFVTLMPNKLREIVFKNLLRRKK